MVTRQLTSYRLPDGRIVPVDEDVARGQATVTFTLQGGEIVEAVRLSDAENDPQLLDDLTRYSKRHDGSVAFQPTVVRFGPGQNEVSIMNRQGGGWGERAYTYTSLWALARHWRLRFVAFGRDKVSRLIVVDPLPRRPLSEQLAGSDKPVGAAYRALQVVVLTGHIRAYLAQHDPKALQQIEYAIDDLEAGAGADHGRA